MFSLFSFCLLVCVVLGKEGMMERFRKREGVTISDATVKMAKITPNCLACVNFCQQNHGLGCSWGHEDHMCKLAVSMWVLNTGGFSELSVSSSHCTYTKMVYEIWVVRGVQRYSLTWSSAQAMCKAEHGRLATRQQLLTARSHGYELCSCGFFADGSAGFVLQSLPAGCWTYFTTGIHDCPTKPTYDGYCIFAP